MARSNHTEKRPQPAAPTAAAQTAASAPAAQKPGPLATLKKNAYLLVPVLIIIAGIALVSTMASTITRNRTNEARAKADLSSKVYSSLLTSDIEKAVGVTKTLERHVVNMAFFISLAVIVFLVLRHNLRREEQKRAAMAGDIERLESGRALQKQVQVYAAAMGVAYPLAIDLDYANNRYQTIENNNAVNKQAAEVGTVDELIRVGASTVSDEGQAREFASLFCRENAVAAFRSGKKELALTHKQVGDDGQDHWMETKVVCIERGHDALRAVALSRCIDEEVRNKDLRIQVERADALLH